jgi:hypothetical protein
MSSYSEVLCLPYSHQCCMCIWETPAVKYLDVLLKLKQHHLFFLSFLRKNIYIYILFFLCKYITGLFRALEVKL